jgi:hypothetical protein
MTRLAKQATVTAGLLIVLTCAAAPTAHAQGTTAVVSGTVVDETGGALPGVTVTIKHVETGLARTLVTNEQGRYRAPALEPGAYEILSELPGFETSVYRGLNLAIGQDHVVNVTLKIGQLQEQVVVTETAPLVETNRSAVTGFVDSQQMRDLPLNRRDFTQLTLLAPAVTAVPSVNPSLLRGMGTQISVAGARPNQMSFLLDGTDVNDQGGQSPGSAAGGLTGVDTVREFQIITNAYSAEYGRTAGAVVSAVTRSGTNALHGSIFEFLRDDAMDARNFFDSATAVKPPFRRNQFGFSVGGPLVRDRTFYFGSYEGLRQDKSLSLVATVPSRATRARADISPIVRPYLELFPLPNGPETGASGRYSSSMIEPTRENYFVVKADHSFSSANTGTIRYTFNQASVATPEELQLFTLTSRNRNQYLMVEQKHIFSSALLNEVRFAYNRTFLVQEVGDLVPINPSLLFIPGRGFGSLTVSGLTTMGTSQTAPQYLALNTFQLVDNVSWSLGPHNMKFGVSLIRWLNNQDAPFQIGGTFAFTSIDNFVRNIANNFEGMLPDSSAQRNWRQNLIGLYAQDDFVVSSRLTLNLGLRYEFITTPTDTEGRISTFRNLLGTEFTVGGPMFENPSLKNFAPRVGFAWNPFGDGKTSIRGGGGFFYEPVLANFYRSHGQLNPPYFRAASQRNPTFPHPFEQTLDVAQRIDLLQFDLENPYMLQFSLTLQRELLPQTVVTTGYLGSRGRNQFRNIEANQAVPTILSDGRYFFPVNSVRLNPAFGSIRLRTTDGNSWYNGFIAGVTRRFSGGFQFQASYTLGNSVDEGSISAGSQDFGNGFQPRYGFDRSDNEGPSDYDIRHNFVLNSMWELPFGKQMTGAAAALAGGWQVGGVVTLRSGVPFTPVLGFDRARALPRSGGAGQRPDLIPGVDIIRGGPTQYFNPLAFGLPEAGTFGNLGRNTLRGPGFATVDASVFKNVGIRNGSKLQFRFEAYNLLNRANFGLPAATVFNASGRVDNAGEITNTVGTSRQMQVAMRLEF